MTTPTTLELCRKGVALRRRRRRPRRGQRPTWQLSLAHPSRWSESQRDTAMSHSKRVVTPPRLSASDCLRLPFSPLFSSLAMASGSEYSSSSESDIPISKKKRATGSKADGDDFSFKNVLRPPRSTTYTAQALYGTAVSSRLTFHSNFSF
jgi:hypothetical protein